MTPAFAAAATQALGSALVGFCLLALPGVMAVDPAGSGSDAALALQAVAYVSGCAFVARSALSLRSAFAELRKARAKPRRGR